MPLTTAARMLADCTQENVNCGPFGFPEVPNLSWGNNNGGFMLDYPLVNGVVTRGGWQRTSEQTHTLPWWQFMNTYKNPLSNKNPVKNQMWVQVRYQRRYYRRKDNKSWDLQGTAADPSTSSEHFFGESLVFDSKPLGATSYTRVRNGVTETFTVNDPGKARVSAPSGGSFYRASRDWVPHGYPLGDHEPSFDIYDAVGGTVQFRLVPGADTPGAAVQSADFNWEDFDAGFSAGHDWYKQNPRKTEGPCCFGRLVRPTNRWQVAANATVRENRFSRPKAPGLTEQEFLDYPMPVPPEEEVWIERGAYDSVTDTQQLVLKRSAPAPSNKTYTLTKSRGEYSATPASVVMASGTTSVQFAVTVPGTPSSSQQMIYVTDGAEEDHWATFTIGNGSSTGDPGGPITPTGGDTSRTQRLRQSGNLAASPWELEGGSVGTADGDGWQLVGNGGTDYVKQQATGFAASEAATITIEAKPGNADWLLIRSESSDFSNGRHQFVNASTGAIGVGTAHGTSSAFVMGTPESLEGGGYRFKLTLAMAAANRALAFRWVSGDNVWTAGSGLNGYIRKPQFQSGAKGTNYIASTSAAVTRTLTTVETASASPIASGAPSTAVVTLKDNAGAGWDQFIGVELVSSLPARLAVTPNTDATNAAGEVTFALTAGADEGDAELTASAGAITATPAEVTVGTAEAIMSAPDAPVVTVVNSDTMSVNLTSVDAEATHVEISIRWPDYVPTEDELPTSAGAPYTVTIPKADLPLVITDLKVAAYYVVTARAVRGALSSPQSEQTLAKLYRLFVYAHLEPGAAGVTGLQVQAGSIPPAGHVMPSILYGQSSTEQFDVATVTFNGKTQSRITLQLSAQPPGPKIRHGDLACMAGFKVMGSGSIYQTPIMYNATVVEGP